MAAHTCNNLPLQPLTLRVTPLLRELVHRAAAWKRVPTTPIEFRLARVIIDEIAGLDEEPLGLSRPSDERLCRMVNAMLADLADSRPVDEWAECVGMTPRTLARHFREQTGLGIVAWRQRARVLRAIEMLAIGKDVTTIAMDLGYDNISAFIAMFRRVMGVTPGHYRREGREAS
ncbi:helix-turn-helix domain-containing protein [Rhizobium oryzicola]|uniref:AraC family transcriptional regulator n=1 Tax=Rhizobium oryzicola TaxID=1232668 RepID=A0ABT8T426_9HYPH|nr:AraC family transcriptional regulator [Rhizobium oryzicola]MDO1585446.1 AraC family transcriptional regulator [Rhizobium oryzicola]